WLAGRAQIQQVVDGSCELMPFSELPLQQRLVVLGTACAQHGDFGFTNEVLKWRTQLVRQGRREQFGFAGTLAHVVEHGAKLGGNRDQLVRQRNAVVVVRAVLAKSIGNRVE